MKIVDTIINIEVFFYQGGKMFSVSHPVRANLDHDNIESELKSYVWRELELSLLKDKPDTEHNHTNINSYSYLEGQKFKIVDSDLTIWGDNRARSRGLLK